jgi:hypothetical protein
MPQAHCRTDDSSHRRHAAGSQFRFGPGPGGAPATLNHGRHGEAIFAGLLVLAHVVVMFVLPVLPGHDVPQHLAIGRILADYDDPALPFRATFEVAAGPNPYFTSYYFLVALSRWVSVTTACRILYAAYAILLPLSFGALDAALHPTGKRTARAIAAGTYFIWNPIAIMGFVPFLLALPAFFFGVAAHFREQDPGRPWSNRALRLVQDPRVAVGAATAIATSLHVVVGGILVGFVALDALLRPSRHRASSAIVACSGGLLAVGLWISAGAEPMAPMPWADLAVNTKLHGLLNGTIETLRLRWSPPDQKGKMFVATVLGAYPYAVKVAIGMALTFVCVLGLWATRLGIGTASPPTKPGATTKRKGAAWTLAAFLLLTLIAPTSIQVPNDMCLIDLRLFVFGITLALWGIGFRAFDAKVPRVAFAGFLAFSAFLGFRQLDLVTREAEPAFRLLRRLGSADVVLALTFHNRSEHLDEDNRLTQYLPVYHTVWNGGVTTSLWSRFTQHLPLDFRPERLPPRPPDWAATQFAEPHVAAATHVLAERPEAEDGDDALNAYARIEALEGSLLEPPSCDGRWCLWRRRGPDAVGLGGHPLHTPWISASSAPLEPELP